MRADISVDRPDVQAPRTGEPPFTSVQEPECVRSFDHIRAPVPSPVPERNRNVYFVGAGLSCALGMPNTAALITDVKRELDWESWRHSAGLGDDLIAAFEAFYPDGGDTGFTPDAVDFFSVLHSYVEVCAGFPGSLPETADFFRRLRFGIANLLIKRLKEADPHLEAGSDYLDEVVQPGNIVVTSNWDFGIEHYARLHGVPVRWRGRGTRTGELVVLKLHGAIDWTLGSEARIGRFGALAFSPPYIVTMARGMTGDLGPLREIWRDAYEALSRAQRLEIVGYSLPDDDIEIRTMLRAAVRRGEGPEEIVVRNPAPDVHVRFRRFLRREVQSNYLPVDAV